MADDAPGPLEELLEQSEDGAVKEKPTRKFPLAKIIVFVVIACAAAGAAWAAAQALTAPPEPTTDAEHQMIDPAALPPQENSTVETHGSSSPILYGVDSIIVNLYGTEARRYLKTTIAFSLKDEDARKEIERRKLILIDRLIVLLSSKKIEDIDGYEGKEELKREIRDEVNNLLGMKDAVTQVYYADFIIQ